MLFVNSSFISLQLITLLIVHAPLLIEPYLFLSYVVSKYVTFSSLKNGSYEYRAIAQVDSNGNITGIAVSDNNGNGYIPSSCKGDV